MAYILPGIFEFDETYSCIIRTLKGKPVDVKDFEAIQELAIICSLCNDSGVDYNEVIVL